MSTPTNRTTITLNVNTAAQQMVSAMAFSVMASSLGALMGATDVTKSPAKTKYNEAGLASLRDVFGADAVSRAVAKALPKTDILALANATETIVLEDLHKKFTESEVNSSLAACNPGDYRCVLTVANALHGNANKASPIASSTVAAGTVNRYQKMKRPAVMILDTKTGIKYASIAAFGRALAPEYGIDPKVKFIGYAVMQAEKDKNRFQRV